MADDLLTLAELAERSGVEIRTLRSWMAQGVVPGAENVGRNARYAPEALLRALAARAMREIYGLTLAEIRQDLLTADAARLESYAAMASPTAEPPIPVAEISPPGGTSAADYLRRLRKSGAFGDTAAGAPASRQAAAFSVPRPPAAPPSPAPGGSSLARLAEALERLAGSRPSRRKARGDVRVHIAITPDLELTIRGDHSPEEIARVEQIADLLRILLTGGADHE
jgi:DNA-binding transcriptional MerR regulator